MKRSRYFLAALMGIGISQSAPADEPTQFEIERGTVLAQRSETTPNQRLAETIAEHLRLSGQLRHYQIDVVYQNGVAALNGTVADESQRDEAVKLAQAVPGVERVLDYLLVEHAAGLERTQAMMPIPQEPAPLPRKAAGPDMPAVPQGPAMAGNPNGPVEPVPVFSAPSPGPYDAVQPRMPPYAWPTYAPYNNYSRVASPTLYPYNAWPYIGPSYPFPKIPPGWRSVKLEWQDGFWWYSKHSNSHDWWRVRYW